MFKPMTEKEITRCVQKLCCYPDYIYFNDICKDKIDIIKYSSMEIFKAFDDKYISIRKKDEAVKGTLELLNFEDRFQGAFNLSSIKTEKDHLMKETMVIIDVADLMKENTIIFKAFVNALEECWLDDSLEMTITFDYHLYGFFDKQKINLSFTEVNILSEMSGLVIPLIEYLEFLKQNGISKHNNESFELYELNYAN